MKLLKSMGSGQSHSQPAPQHNTAKASITIKSEEPQRTQYHSVHGILPIGGLQVPIWKPAGLELYQNQRQMIGKLRMALEKEENALIESPTGSGKTLGLLMGPTGWLHAYKSEQEAMAAKCPVHGKLKAATTSLDESDLAGGCTRDSLGSNGGDARQKRSRKDSTNTINLDDSSQGSSPSIINLDESSRASFEQEPPSWQSRQDLEESRASDETSLLDDGGGPKGKKCCTCAPRVRIFYATRTHKQIAQVVSEYRRLPYATRPRCQASTSSSSSPAVNRVEENAAVSWKPLRHTILGSRANYCVNEAVTASFGGGGIDGRCKEACASKIGCQYKSNLTRKFGRPGYENATYLRENIAKVLGEERGTAFDMEDLKEAMKRRECCPYFAATANLRLDADIIFCPFNYLIDPAVKKGSSINLEGAIVVLDEAHNIESACRDAVSVEFSEAEVALCLSDLAKKVEHLQLSPHWHEEKGAKLGSGPLADFGNKNDGGSSADNSAMNMVSKTPQKQGEVEVDDGTAAEIFQSLQKIENFFKNLLRLMKSLSSTVPTIPHTFDHKRLEEELRTHGLYLGEPVIKELEDALSESNSGPGGQEGGNNVPNALRNTAKLAPMTLRCVERFLIFIGLFKAEENRPLYRGHISYEQPPDEGPSRKNSRQNFSSAAEVIQLDDEEDNDRYGGVENNAPYSRLPQPNYSGGRPGNKRGSTLTNQQQVKLDFWCMSPAVAFRHAFRDTRTVVLASGTLSPIDSFERELGVPFQKPIHGGQVIPREQMFISAVTHGPMGVPLQCTYSNRHPDYLGELRRLIVRVCNTVPGGVLCFMPSYRILDQLLENNLLKRALRGKKYMLVEPRLTVELEETFKTYKEVIENPENYGNNCDGALMVAVCRGKVSEGIDFADEMARCVICVGIPYPNLTDEKVKAKQVFNDEICRLNSNSLTGRNWYKGEAYRPLNQALGRCLRHRNDWGALLLVDKRMESKESREPISSWVREEMRVPVAPIKDGQGAHGFENTMSGLAAFCTKMQQRQKETGKAV